MPVQAAILLVGQYPPLLSTRADLLSEWEVVTADPWEALEALRQRSYEMLILCQSLSDAQAEELIRQATKIRPNIKILALAYDGEGRRLTGSVTLTADIYNPRKFRNEVADLPGGRRDGVAYRSDPSLRFPQLPAVRRCR